MTDTQVANVDKAVDEHAAADSDNAEADARATDEAVRSDPGFHSQSVYAYQAATYRHPEDVDRGIFEAQAKAQSRNR